MTFLSAAADLLISTAALRLYRRLAMLAAFTVVLVVLALACWGVIVWWLAPVLYAPPQLWPMGLALLAAAAWVCQGCRAAVTMLLAAAFIAGPVLGWRSHATVLPAGPDELRVMTWNQGQHYQHDIVPFIQAQQPDVIALQDAVMPDKTVRAMPAYRDYPHMARASEFIVLSRYPIETYSVVITNVERGEGTRRVDVAGARFTLRVRGQVVVLYSIHAPSPRYELDQIFGIRTAYPPKPTQGPTFWKQQRAVLAQICARMEAETQPTLVLGDWNMPCFGPSYRAMTRRFYDAHAEAGSGYGFTCPADLWTPVTLGRPWLRIDYILAARAKWQVLACATESESTAQHSAVAARLRLL